MPRGDGTGPMGQGPMTGRGTGRCAGNNVGGYGFGRQRFGRGLGFGFGMGNSFNQSENAEASEKNWIENVINALKNQLSALEKRKKDLEDR